MGGIGKFLIFWGVILVFVGLLLTVMPKIPFLGKLPGDIVIKRDNLQLYFPIVTCIVISLLLTILFNLFRR